MDMKWAHSDDIQNQCQVNLLLDNDLKRVLAID